MILCFHIIVYRYTHSPPSFSEEKCDFLINRCRGLDETEIIDDEGEAQKTLSIENSFRRGSVTTMEAIWRGLLDLFVRLPLLLRDRASWSGCPKKAYPMTIRLTIRRLDQKLAAAVVNNNNVAAAEGGGLWNGTA